MSCTSGLQAIWLTAYTRGAEFTIFYLPSLIYIRNYAAVLPFRGVFGTVPSRGMVPLTPKCYCVA